MARATRNDPPRITAYRDKLAAILRSLKDGDDHFRQITEAIEAEGAAEIGLARPITAPARP